MAGKDFLGRGKDLIDDIFHELSVLEDKVVGLANIKQPTHPLYLFYDWKNPNPGDLPDDPVEAQHAGGFDDDTFWQYTNGGWVFVGGGRWYDLTLEPPWVSVGGPYHDPQFSKASPMHLKFRGAIDGGGPGDIIAFLPVQFWPDAVEHYVISFGNTPTVIEVSATDGSVTPL